MNNEAKESAATISYREASPDDADRIVQFQIAMAEETEGIALNPLTCAAGVAAVFANPELGRYFVADDGTRVVASLMITYEWSDWRNGQVWWIQSVYVDPASRRQKIYAGLYTFVKQRVSLDDRIRGIRLYVDRTNESAQNVYTRLGMNGEHYKVYEWMK